MGIMTILGSECMCRSHKGCVGLVLGGYYNVLSIYRGHYSLNFSGKTPHSSPVRAGYGVLFVSPKSGLSLTSVIVVLLFCVHYRVICGRDISRVSSTKQLAAHHKAKSLQLV